MGNPLDSIPEGEPSLLVAGDTWTWKRSDLSGDYPVSSYSLTYAMQREGPTGAPVTFVAQEVGNDYVVNVPVATTSPLVSGTWQWTAYAVRTSDNARVTVAGGVFTVKPNPAIPHDARTHAVKVLASIEALIEGRATSDVNNYSIAGRALAKMGIEELLRWKAHYRALVNRERLAAQGVSAPRRHVVRFS